MSVLVDATPDLNRPLAATDPEVAAAIAAELRRQQTTLEMIASENFAPVAVMQAQGSVLTNKYAEGYPGRRYYGGCEHVDVIEQLAIDRLKALFDAEYANVQPHSGAQANAAAMAALLQPGDTILGLDLAHGGHLTHGMRLNFSGKLYDVAAYHVGRDDHRVDMAEVERLAHERKPKLIVAGWSAYPRQLDFAEFRRIADEVGAYLMVDMAHFAGLVARGPAPVARAARPRGHLHHAQDARRSPRRRSSSRTPSSRRSSTPRCSPASRAARWSTSSRPRPWRSSSPPSPRSASARSAPSPVPGSSPTGCSPTTAATAGIGVVSGGTDVHLVLADLRESPLDGRQAEDRLHAIGITVNRNAVPFDPRPPMVSSGVRIGTPALAARGFAVDDFTEVADIIAQALQPTLGETESARLRARVTQPRRAPPALPGPDGDRPMTPRAPGARPSRAPRLPLAQPRAEELLRRRDRRRRRATAWRPPTTWRRTTASPTSRCWRRGGWRAATWPATPR